MVFSVNIKLILMASIYVLHITFFDALMSGILKDNQYSAIVVPESHQHSKNNLPAESCYRLLIKHEITKQLPVGFPDRGNFVICAFAGLFSEKYNLPGFDTSILFSSGIFKLYRLFRVFLI